MKTTMPNLRKLIRKVITESKMSIMDSSHPDYESVAEVIQMVTRELMFGRIGADEVPEQCELYAGDYQVYHHLEYIIEKVMSRLEAMGL